MRKLWAVVLLASVLGAGGCSGARYLVYLLDPGAGKTTVPAEHDLARQTVAIVIYAGPETQLEYQNVHVEVFDAVAAEMKRNVKDVTLIDPRRIIRYQAENPDWNADPPSRLCGVFGCDAVLLISLTEFTSREPGSIHLARGRITAEASVYEPAKRGPDARPAGCVWRSETIRIVHPKDTPVTLSVGNDWALRMATEKMFAATLVRNFYKHKVARQS